MNNKNQHLIAIAKRYMSQSSDPIHDIEHVRRVVTSTSTIAKQLHLNSEQTEALVLAAWWHDVARSVTKKPSIIVMPFIDDLISAILLWKETIRCGLFGSVAGMATRIIFCKSFGTGKILTKILMRKKNRIMVDILHDADLLDVIHIERTKRLFSLAESSVVYSFGYKLAIWWFLSITKMKMKTSAAQKELLEMLKEFKSWMESYSIREWHIHKYGKAWFETKMRHTELFIYRLESQLLYLGFFKFSHALQELKYKLKKDCPNTTPNKLIFLYCLPLPLQLQHWV